MTCDQIEEHISALCDGQKIPPSAAIHIGECHLCQSELNEFAAIGAELRRLASLDDVAADRTKQDLKPAKQTIFWQRGFNTMKIPKMAFAAMLIAICALSSGLLLVRARAAATSGRFLELKFHLPPTGQTKICVMTVSGSPKDNLCNFAHHGRDGLLLMNTRVIAKSGDRAQLGVRAKYLPGSGDAEIDYSEALFEDVPQSVLSVEPGEKREIQVAGLGSIDVETEYLDHIPPLVASPGEALDPNPNEFRIVAPVLVRDDQVIANFDGSSLDYGESDATLMLYVPGDGRYLISRMPFEQAVPGTVHLGKIKFSMDGHNYLLLTSVPILDSENVWVKHEVDFKPSQRMARASDARDDRPDFLVRSLKKLQEQRIDH
jgi:hypothetical protein